VSGFQEVHIEGERIVTVIGGLVLSTARVADDETGRVLGYTFETMLFGPPPERESIVLLGKWKTWEEAEAAHKRFTTEPDPLEPFWSLRSHRQ
jgi:hypothetical protein